LQKLKGDSLAVLEYHRWDDFECPDGVGRINYYDLHAYPTARFDGKTEVMGGGPSTFYYYLNAYNLEMESHPSACNLNISMYYDATTRLLNINSAITAVHSLENAHLRYAVAESHIYHPWKELDSLHHVVRKMLPDSNGVPLPPMNPNDSYADSQSCILNPEWNEKNCYVVVYVQRDDLSDKPVARSARIGPPLIWVFGDANGDDVTDVADVVFLINYVFKNGPTPHPLASGDPDNDCMVGVDDVIYLINWLFREGPASLRGCA
jgi:hypothetical protein